MSEIKLLPCPFCGGEAEIVGINNGNPFYVVCVNCGLEFGHPAYGKEYYYHQIIEAWNTRKPMERIVERLKGQEKQYLRRKDEYEKIGSTREAFRQFLKACSYNNAIEIVKKEGGIE